MKYLHFFIIAMTLLSCSKKTSTPLTANQDQHFRDTLANMALFNTAYTEGTESSIAGKTDSLSSLGFVKKNRLSAEWLGLSADTVLTNKKNRIIEIIKAAVSKGDCTVKKIEFQTSNSKEKSTIANLWNTPSQHLDYSVTGASCPISASGFVDVNVSPDSKKYTVRAGVEFALRTTELKSLSDIDHVTNTIDATVTSPDKRSVSATVNYNGTLHSQSEGNLKYYAIGGGSGTLKTDSDSFASGNGEIKTGIEFGDFTAEVVVKGEQIEGAPQGRALYFVNTVERTEKEMDPYVDALNLR